MGSGISTLNTTDVVEENLVGVGKVSSVVAVNNVVAAPGTSCGVSDQDYLDEIRGASTTGGKNISSAGNRPSVREKYDDSIFLGQFLSKLEADLLLGHLCKVAICKNRDRLASVDWKNSKYPLWTITYGAARKRDGAKALDRWGSYHESWTRVEDPTDELLSVASKIRKIFNLKEEALNSMVVNFYWDGQSTFIPAHRDTVHCLDDDSHVYCLSLGAPRDFLLCANNDAGKYKKDEMKIVKEWRTGHGSLFALGQKTNEKFCHAVPQEAAITDLRISIIFRSVTKSFIDVDARPKAVKYANGNAKVFQAECIVTNSYNDVGRREHIADLIADREALKKKKMDGVAAQTAEEGGVSLSAIPTAVNASSGNTELKKPKKLVDIIEENIGNYFMGEGVAALNSLSSKKANQ